MNGVRAGLVGRKLLHGKLLDVELSIRGLLRGFGLKVGLVSKGRFAARVRALIAGQPMLERVIEPMLRARRALRAEFHTLDRAMLAIVRADATCRRLMTVPGVGVLVAVTFTSAVGDPASCQPSCSAVDSSADRSRLTAQLLCLGQRQRCTRSLATCVSIAKAWRPSFC